MKKWRRLAARSEDAKVAELDEARSDAEELGKPWEPPREYDSVYSLSTGEMGTIVKKLGIVLTPEELTRLVNTFDLDGDGTVHMDEFLSFTGRKRSKAAGDAALALRVSPAANASHRQPFMAGAHDARRLAATCCCARCSLRFHRPETDILVVLVLSAVTCWPRRRC